MHTFMNYFILIANITMDDFVTKGTNVYMVAIVIMLATATDTLAIIFATRLPMFIGYLLQSSECIRSVMNCQHLLSSL
jgi:hypothetical protein